MAKERLNGAEITIKALVDLGVEVIFGYPGGAVLPIYDAVSYTHLTLPTNREV